MEILHLLNKCYNRNYQNICVDDGRWEDWDGGGAVGGGKEWLWVWGAGVGSWSCSGLEIFKLTNFILKKEFDVQRF